MNDAAALAETAPALRARYAVKICAKNRNESLGREFYLPRRCESLRADLFMFCPKKIKKINRVQFSGVLCRDFCLTLAQEAGPKTSVSKKNKKNKEAVDKRGPLAKLNANLNVKVNL
ncbi:hypothetical protein KKF91_22140 [Myxococcota bacterium]|nr:hypothetical protein [Myxococcota bacterium]MBU1433243.1 hypothetical protein [Myxococcota bacterium]MBU1898909.1 hypothetical protein [Myxococcota bacterium]